jgi:hypothetical protein
VDTEAPDIMYTLGSSLNSQLKRPCFSLLLQFCANDFKCGFVIEERTSDFVMAEILKEESEVISYNAASMTV